MKQKLLLAAAAAMMLAGTFTAPASATVVCNSCDYINGQQGTYVGTHSPVTNDNSTVSNATTGQNGNFSNTWVFDINPGGEASVNAIFLPTDNISNFDVQLYSVSASNCGPSTPTAGGACSSVTTGGLIADGNTNPNFASTINFTDLVAGKYAFIVSGTISGLAANQPASYVGQLQVRQDVPEPASLALVTLGLLGAGAATRKKKAA